MDEHDTVFTLSTVRGPLQIGHQIGDSRILCLICFGYGATDKQDLLNHIKKKHPQVKTILRPNRHQMIV